MEKILFKEEQRFIGWWLWVILLVAFLVSTVPFLYGIYSQEVLGIAWGNKPTGTSTLIFFLLFDSLVIGGISLFIIKMRLIVEVRTDGIWYKYPPQYSKRSHIKKEEIERFEMIIYKPLIEYGGWGIKGKKGNRSFTAKGNCGLQIYLKNGRKLLIGTQRKQALKYAVEKMMKN